MEGLPSNVGQGQKIAAFRSSYIGTRTPVGAAEGCDLLPLLQIAKSCMSAKALCLFVTDHYPAALQLNRFTACVKLKRSVYPRKTPKKD
ncbi:MULTISPECIES: hypothetical protein [Pseudomonas]|uniref:hypothetical protein n=1 Tax=Pseudomonas TaxID=286 RepID=UPI00117B6837|nr:MULTISPECIES: hypothetical protein [Pseudomonas]NHX02518.1 hypothetical protein [Pseudomonas koreensis]